MPQNFSLNPLQTAVDNNGKSMSREWRPWFDSVSNAVNSLYQYGTSSQRPTTNVYLGQLYFDTTLGTLIMLTNLNPQTWSPFSILTTFTADAFLYTNSAGAITATSAATNGQLLIGSTGSVPVKTTLTGTAHEVIVTNGAGSITLSTPQAIDTTSSVTFANVTDSALTPDAFIYPSTGGLLASTSAATNGQLLIGSTGLAPVASTLTAGSGVSITNGAGTITIAANPGGVVTSITGTANEIIASSATGNVTLSTPQAIATTSTPTFGGLTLTPLTGYLYANASSAITASTTIPNTSITGLGTMSTQNANAVAITGGSINGTTVGATTASTGAFTSIVGTTTNSTQSLFLTDTGSNGCNIRLLGNGATTPSKYIRAQGGLFQILNNAYNSVILTLTDAGDLSATNFDSTPIGAINPSTGAFTKLSSSTNAKVNAQNSSAQSIPTGTNTVLTGWTTIFDVTSSFVASTGIFTVPDTGYYACNAQISFIGNSPVNTTFALQWLINGSTQSETGLAIAQVATGNQYPVTVNSLLLLTAGNTLSLQAFQSSGGARLISSSALQQYIHIYRIA